jgi:hypothetical protein
MEDVGDRSHGHTRIASLDGAQCRTRHSRALGYQLGREPAAKPSQLDVFTQLFEKA